MTKHITTSSSGSVMAVWHHDSPQPELFRRQLRSGSYRWTRYGPLRSISRPRANRGNFALSGNGERFVFRGREKRFLVLEYRKDIGKWKRVGKSISAYQSLQGFEERELSMAMSDDGNTVVAGNLVAVRRPEQKSGWKTVTLYRPSPPPKQFPNSRERLGASAVSRDGLTVGIMVSKSIPSNRSFQAEYSSQLFLYTRPSVNSTKWRQLNNETYALTAFLGMDDFSGLSDCARQVPFGDPDSLHISDDGTVVAVKGYDSRYFSGSGSFWEANAMAFLVNRRARSADDVFTPMGESPILLNIDSLAMSGNGRRIITGLDQAAHVYDFDKSKNVWQRTAAWRLRGSRGTKVAINQEGKLVSFNADRINPPVIQAIRTFLLS